MAWVKIPADEAKSHPLYGIGGWLVVFAIGVLLGVMSSIGQANALASDAGVSLAQLLSARVPVARFYQFTLMFSVLSAAIIYWLLFSKNPRFRLAVTCLFLLSFPVGFGIAQFWDVSPSNFFARGLISWLISGAVWCSYLNLSKRVRVTFEHAIKTSPLTGRPLSSSDGAVASIAPREESESSAIFKTSLITAGLLLSALLLLLGLSSYFSSSSPLPVSTTNHQSSDIDKRFDTLSKQEKIIEAEILWALFMATEAVQSGAPCDTDWGAKYPILQSSEAKKRLAAELSDACTPVR